MSQSDSDLKPGWHSSEFWVTLVSHVVAIAVLFGVVPQESVDSVTQAVTGVAALLTVLVTSLSYTLSRKEVKVKYVTAKVARFKIENKEDQEN